MTAAAAATTAKKTRLSPEERLAEITAQLQDAQEGLESALEAGLERAVAVGLLLRRARKCWDGVAALSIEGTAYTWTEWVEARTPYTRQHAARLIRVAEHWGEVKGRARTVNDALDLISGRKAPLTEAERKQAEKDRESVAKAAKRARAAEVRAALEAHKVAITDELVAALKDLGIPIKGT